MINRLVDPTAGVIKFAGKPLMAYKVRDLRWDLGYVLQQIALFPTMTVAQNIAVIPEMKGWSRQKIRTATDDLLAMVDLPPASGYVAAFASGNENHGCFCHA